MNSLMLQTVCVDDTLVHRSDCQHCAIRHRMLFAPLDLEAASNFLWPIHHMISPAKTILFHQGQPPQSVFSIRRGFLKLTQASENGNERIVRLLGPGSCVGIEALLNEHYEQTAEAITELDYCVVPIKTIFQLEQEQPVLYRELEKHWHHQLQQADSWLLELLSGTIRERFARFLIMLEDMQKLPACRIILISNQDIASILGTTEESISRCVTEFRKNELIQRVEKRLYLLNLDGLKDAAGENDD